MESTSTGTAHPKHTDTIVGVVAGMVSQEPESISPDTRFLEDLGFDSTMVLELLMNLENELGVELDPETLEPSDLDTVRALVAYMTRQLEA